MTMRFPPFHFSRPHLAWLLVAFLILFAVVVRVRLRATPLERDEGEYAYAGQLMLQGVPPYKLAYNMKLPGTYAAYALILAAFGQSAAAIHLGLAIVNAISIVLMFMVARKLLDDAGAVTAAAVFALMSLSSSVLGLAAHATHFVVLCALTAILLLLRNCEPVKNPPATQPPAPGENSLRAGRNRSQLFLSGLFFGLAILMKQHGILFAVFGAIYLLWFRANQLLDVKPRRSRGRHSRPDPIRRNRGLILIARDLGIFALGGALPYLLMCLILAAGGVFHEFWFWTFTYARKYASSTPMAEGAACLRQTMGGMLADNPYFWISSALGAVLMWWDERCIASTRFFLIVLALCSTLAVSAGLYFREHYFIMLLPTLALLNGVAVSRGLRLLRQDMTIELLLTVPILLLFLIGVGACFVTFGALWFSMSPNQVSARIYGTTLFSEALKASEVIKAYTASDARIAVIGSEPEIYFYTHRRSVTGYIYTYPLMEKHNYALKMQEQMIHDIEVGRPEYIVFVKYDLSWLGWPDSERKIFSWWDTYWTANYDLEQSFSISDDVPVGPDSNEGGPAAPPKSSSLLLVLKRK